MLNSRQPRTHQVIHNTPTKLSTNDPQKHTQHIHRHTLVLLFRIIKCAQNVLKCVLEAYQISIPVDNSATEPSINFTYQSVISINKYNHQSID